MYIRHVQRLFRPRAVFYQFASAIYILLAPMPNAAESSEISSARVTSSPPPRQTTPIPAMRGVRTPIFIGASDDPPPTVAYVPVTLSPVPEVFFSLFSA